MKPILYPENERDFTSNGLGRLSDAISCIVTEERNSVYELEMQYPITGNRFDEIKEDRIIYAVAFDGGQKQAFRIYKISEPLNGIVTICAEHISYLLNKMVAMPFSAGSCAEAFAKLPANIVGENPFTFWTDKDVAAKFNLSVPKEIRNRVLGGESGSILDVYGKGDYEFDNFIVKLHLNRGTDNGVTLRYGKNITDLTKIIDTTNIYIGIVPYWSSETETMTLPEKVLMSEQASQHVYKVIKTVDFSSNFEDKPTESQLRDAAQKYLEANEGWKIKQNIDVSFAALWQTEEYKDIAPLERVRLCDLVSVYVVKMNVNVKAKVVKTVYNVLLERYDSIQLGDASNSFNKVMEEQYIAPVIQQTTTRMDKAINHATKLITGGLGGHVVINVNANGEPNEILVMDTDDIFTAVNVLRINMNGIGFSSTGYNGPFRSAWTLDGHFVADFIDTGTLVANIIKAGLLSDEKMMNWWNMETGEFHLSSTSTIGDSSVASEKQITELSGKIDTTAQGLTSEFSKQIAETKEYADNATDDKLRNYSTTTQMNTAIEQSAEGIKQEASTTYETKTNASANYTELSGKIELTSESIQAEVTRAQNQEVELAAAISVNASGIATKVSKGDVSSQLEQEADGFTIRGNRIAIQSTNFTLTADGKVKAIDGEFSGSLTSGRDTSSQVRITGGQIAFLNNKNQLGSIYATTTTLSLNAPIINDTLNGFLQLSGGHISLTASGSMSGISLSAESLILGISSLAIGNKVGLTEQVTIPQKSILPTTVMTGLGTATPVTVMTGITQIGDTIIPRTTTINTYSFPTTTSIYTFGTDKTIQFTNGIHTL